MTKMKFNSQSFFTTLLLSFVLFSVSSCKKTDKSLNNDNIFKFRNYVYYNTSGRVSTQQPIKITLAKDVSSWEANQEIDDAVFSISPSVKGKLQAQNKRTLVFQPENGLQSDTEYTVTLKLKKLFPEVKSEFKKYTFSFKTMKQNFKINIANVQSYSKDWQYLNGNIQMADVISLDQVKQLVSASQNGKQLHLKWDKEQLQDKDFPFSIDSIQRLDEDSEVRIQWNGKSANIDNHGENTFKIIGKNNFSVVGVKVLQSPELHLEINFSDPLKKQQNFNGLVSLEKQEN